MEKMINIDGKEMRMAANGATPRIYRLMFGRDIFADLSHAIEGQDLKDMAVIEQLAFVLGRQGGSIPEDMSIDEWLETIDDPMALITAAGDIVTLWLGNTVTIADGKKKGGRQTAK